MRVRFFKNVMTVRFLEHVNQLEESDAKADGQPRFEKSGIHGLASLVGGIAGTGTTLATLVDFQRSV